MGRIGAELHVRPTLARPRRDRDSRRAARRAVLARVLLAATVVGAPLLGLRRLAVEGDSMAPTFEPDDRLLALRLRGPLRRALVRPGAVVVASDPRAPARVLVKRVASVSPAGVVTLLGDNPSSSTDSRTFGPVDRRSVRALVVRRYVPGPAAPARRACGGDAARR
jgi:nickel-type superoxide dismutase maturation protease